MAAVAAVPPALVAAEMPMVAGTAMAAATAMAMAEPEAAAAAVAVGSRDARTIGRRSDRPVA
jgi:hypothetical protein